MAKIGVLLPTHKRPKLIWRAIKSLEAQTCQNYYLVVIGNGMNDKEFNLYGLFEWDSHRSDTIVLNYPSFANLAMALQMGLAHLPAVKYVAVLEDDDEWHPEFLEKMSGALDERPEIAMAYCDEVEIAPGDIEVDWTGHLPTYERSALLEANWIHFPVQMWRYDKLMELGGFCVDTSGAADWDTALRLSAHGIYHLREQLSTHHWLTDKYAKDPQNNCLDPKKMAGANRWVKIRKQVGVYS